MQHVHGKLVCAVLLLAVLHSAIARVFVFDDGQPEYGAADRTKRQSLEWVFEQDSQPLREAELTLTGVEGRRARQSPSGVWDLGYEAGDILRPPASGRTSYWVKREADPAIVWGTPKEGAVINRPQRSSEYEEDSEEEEGEKGAEAGYSPEGESHHQVPASIYSFVKTDKHGNFKWAVHKGPPVRG